MFDIDAYSKEYRNKEENKEKFKLYQKAYRAKEENKKKAKAYSLEYKKEYRKRDVCIESTRKWRQENSDKIKDYGSMYREKNREMLNKKQNEKRKENREKIKRVTEDGRIFEILDILYKIGSHGFVYYECGDEWVKSQITAKELNRMIWTNPNEL